MRPEKQFLLDEIKEKIEGKPAMLILSYRGMNPNTADDFRSQISKTGGGVTVVNKRIFAKAAEESGISVQTSDLTGHIAFVYSGDDAVETIKGVYDYSRENEELYDVLLGHFEGKICSASDLLEISKLPSQDQMRAQLLGVLSAPLAGTVSVFNAILTSVINCLENKTQKEEA